MEDAAIVALYWARDEQALAEKCAAADERAMEALTNLGLHRVLELSKDHVGCGVLLLDLIQELNRDPQVDGILCQLPLPGHLDEEAVLNAIARDKDVDCFHPYNVGRLMIGDPVFLPCTPAGVMEMLREYGIPVRGRRCVVLGRSNIVGKPMAMLLLQQDGTVTVCHSKTPGLAAITREADILVSAVGRVGLVTPDMVKEGAVVIDVAMNRNEAGKLCGDVDLAAVEPKASYITPVPGGVGPMTRAMLMKNTTQAAAMQNGVAI